VSKPIFSPAALKDVREIHAYIAEDNLSTAIGFIERIEKRCSQLAKNPGIGKRRFGLFSGMRSTAEGNYIIFFKLLPDAIEIVRVAHAKRNLKKIFKHGN
jgi:toxin ParE1/3/4